MRFRVKPTPEVSTEIKRVEKKDLIEMMRRAAMRMADGDADEHIQRAVAWEGHSEAFADWLVREVRASFEAFGMSRRSRTTLELWASAISRLAILLVLLLFGSMLLQDRDSTWSLLIAFPVILLAFLYTVGFLVSASRVIKRMLGRDRQEPPPE
jgi:hypothetical protein